LKQKLNYLPENSVRAGIVHESWRYKNIAAQWIIVQLTANKPGAGLHFTGRSPGFSIHLSVLRNLKRAGGNILNPVNVFGTLKILLPKGLRLMLPNVSICLVPKARNLVFAAVLLFLILDITIAAH